MDAVLHHAAGGAFGHHPWARGRRRRFPSQAIPSPSMLVGIIGAAMGVDRREHKEFQRLQDAVDEVAWLVHREPRTLVDYQTTDLSKPHMVGPMWAHDGVRAWAEERAGAIKTRTLVSERDIACDVDLTAIIGWSLDETDAGAVLAALDQPAMPLSIGARWALPSEPVAGEIVDAASLAEAAKVVRERWPALRFVPIRTAAPFDTPLVAVTASRDWRTRRHTGSQILSEYCHERNTYPRMRGHSRNSYPARRGRTRPGAVHSRRARRSPSCRPRSSLGTRALLSAARWHPLSAVILRCAPGP